MKIPVAIKILNEATGPKANVEFMDVSILKTNQFQFLIVFSLTSFLSVGTWKLFYAFQTEVVERWDVFSVYIFLCRSDSPGHSGSQLLSQCVRNCSSIHIQPTVSGHCDT